MRFVLIGFLLSFLTLSLGDCSSDGVPCGNNVCGSGEVCENGECVLGIYFGGDSEDSGCESDEDCPGHQVCTHPDSDPAATCIPELRCEKNHDCQTGLECGEGNFCR